MPTTLQWNCKFYSPGHGAIRVRSEVIKNKTRRTCNLDWFRFLSSFYSARLEKLLAPRDIRGAIYILWKQFGLGREKWFQLSHKTNVGAEKENSRRSSPSLPFPCEACFGGLAEGQPHLKLMQRSPFSSPSSSLGILGLFRYLQGRCEAPRPINAHFLKPQ